MRPREDVCTVKVFNKDGDGYECSATRPCPAHDGAALEPPASCTPDGAPHSEPDYDAPSAHERHVSAWEEKRRIS